ncbi:MAG: hypothetical protein RMM31_09755 [Anaerolineae bacterium]|nr:hypothetical protein [Anaerolineae bacterium]
MDKFASSHTRALAALVVASLILAACGGEQPQQPVQQTDAQTESPKQESAEQPKGVFGTIAKIVKVRDLKVADVTAPVSNQRAALAGLGSALSAQAAPGAQSAPAGGETKPSGAGAAEPLDAYRLTYRLDAEYGSEKQPLTVITNVDAQGRARYEASAISDGKLVTVTLLAVDQMRYTLSSDNADFCMALATEQPEGFPRPTDWLSAYVEEAELAEEGVEVNGFLTDRYTFKQKIDTPEVKADLSGEVWVARGLNIVVRHRGESVGKMLAGPDTTEMQDARVRWELSVERLGSDFKIEVPEACLKGTDLPIPTNAKNLFRAGDMTSFETATTVNEVVAFYKQEMEKAGWTLAEESSYGGTTILTFEKGERKVSVQLEKAEGVTRVMLMLE